MKALRREGHEVYDFKNPAEGDNGFHWSDVDEDWQNWTPEKYVEKLNHPIAEDGFNKDFNAMKWADCCVLVLPSGRSAHTEAGWMKGQGKPTIVLIDKVEPELMYKIYDRICLDLTEVCNVVGETQ